MLIITNDASTISCRQQLAKSIIYLQFLIFSESLSCFEKKLKVYLYGHIVLSENDTKNNLVTLRDC